MTDPLRFPTRPTGPDGRHRFFFGADYNPDQWSRDVWDEDITLMQQVGVNVVSLAIFSWARIQPSEGVWDFEWLDDIMDRLQLAGIAVDLATATASPPAWLTTKHPEILPVTADGKTLWPGGRQHWRPTSPVFREHALRLVEALANRYSQHPALVAWHVSNELGCHNAWDYSDDAATAFRTWLLERHGDLAGINAAWGTAFWSQQYSDIEQILPPRLAASEPNPTQLVDFRRFSSDALRAHLRAENEVLERICPEIPRTTNFMVMGDTRAMDFATWTDDVDFVSNDHYLQPGTDGIDELAFSAARCASLAGFEPWWMMEHSTSAVNWRPVNPPKRPGELMRDSLTHVAHGADAICFFQWRQSVVGAEKYHAAMLPHAGPDSAVFRSVRELGASLGKLAEVAGTRPVRAEVAVLLDHPSWWATDQGFQPSELVDHRDEALAWYRALLDSGVRVDVVGPSDDLAEYRVVVAPLLHVVGPELATRLQQAVEAGTHLVVTYYSGIVDDDSHVIAGGYPGALRDLLGIRVEEFHPLMANQSVGLEGGATAVLWCEDVQPGPETEILHRYADGPYPGAPAVTRAQRGAGTATYVSTHPNRGAMAAIAAEVLTTAEVRPELELPEPGAVITTRRRGQDSDYIFLVPRNPEVTLEMGKLPHEYLHGPETTTVTGTDVVVLRTKQQNRIKN